MSVTPVFIVGCPRSGTTLLSEILAPTSYGSPMETHFITKYFKKLESYGDIGQKDNFFRLMKDILNERPVRQWKLDIDIENFREELESFDYGEIVNQLCFMPFKARGKSSWGDKTPRYIFDLDIIHHLFPDSKYLYIVRDGRDVTLSLLRKPWGPNNVCTCAEYWKQCNAESDTFDNMRENGRLFELSYEDLLGNPDTLAKEIYDFLEEPYPQDKIGDILETINKANFDKWKHSMKAKDVEMFEKIASDTLRRFGYEASSEESGLGSLEKGFWHLHNACFRFKHLLKANTIDSIRIKYFGMEPFAD